MTPRACAPAYGVQEVQNLHVTQPSIESGKSVGAVFGFDVAAAPFDVGPGVTAARDFAGAWKLRGEVAFFAVAGAARAFTRCELRFCVFTMGLGARLLRREIFGVVPFPPLGGEMIPLPFPFPFL